MIAKKILLLLPVIAAAVTIIAVLSSRQCDTVLTEVSKENYQDGQVQADLKPGAVLNGDKVVFNFSFDDFIKAYNANAYSKGNELAESSEWMKTDGHSPYFGYAGDWYIFSVDKSIASLPTLSVYTSSGEDFVYEIKLTFIDHDYRESLAEEYKKMCCRALKTVFAEIDDKELSELYEKLYATALNNFRDNSFNGKPAMLYTKNNIGVYGFYKSGTVNICIVPFLA